MRKVTRSTQKAIVEALRGQKSLAGILASHDIHVSKGTLGRAASGGSVSRSAENDIRRGLALPSTHYWRPCLASETRDALRSLKRAGETWDTFLRRLAGVDTQAGE
jgi:hypothetical protein